MPPEAVQEPFKLAMTWVLPPPVVSYTFHWTIALPPSASVTVAWSCGVVVLLYSVVVEPDTRGLDLGVVQLGDRELEKRAGDVGAGIVGAQLQISGSVLGGGVGVLHERVQNWGQSR